MGPVDVVSDDHVDGEIRRTGDTRRDQWGPVGSILEVLEPVDVWNLPFNDPIEVPLDRINGRFTKALIDG